MTTPPKYALEPLLEHRDRAVDDAKSELGSAVRTCESAAEAKARAERNRMEAEERMAAVRAAEAARLAQGGQRALDLARARDWEVVARAEMEILKRAVEQASAHLERARENAARARAVLAQSMAERDVVARDKDRFVNRVRRNAEAAEEEAAAEAWGGTARIQGDQAVRG
ncbi:MAG: hypothetical protein FWD69_05380 [Polyangiaceae bacterium]|nr:hypothetical protein [Polyangiaceae bacterium]